jgi:hypothetical protein
MTRLGFTGTGKGMSPAQADFLRFRMARGDVTEFHHGDCVGADAEADQIARDYGARIVIHPPEDWKARAGCYREGDIMLPEQPYLIRNHDIVDDTDEMIAAPRSDIERLRSGTWATVRYARKVGRPLLVLPR